MDTTSQPKSPSPVFVSDQTTVSIEKTGGKRPPAFFTHPITRTAGRSIANGILTLLVIAFLTIFGLIVAERGRDKLPAQPLEAAGEALVRTVQHVFNHPDTYFWKSENVNSLALTGNTLINSAGLLLAAMTFAALVGIGLGLTAAFARHRVGSMLVMVLSVLSMSTPSFILGMLLWMVNIYFVHRALDLPALPQTGFGWDLHILMPALVLAARPLAQIAQVTYISLTEVLGQDFIRTARAKGLAERAINTRHALRNILIPILTTIGTSLRYSLASLPVVETFFLWPGVGLTLLQAIELRNAALITDLIVSLGLFFLLFNLVIDLVYPFLDPRLRRNGGAVDPQETPSLRDFLNGLRDVFTGIIRAVRGLFVREKPAPLPPLLAKLATVHPTEDVPQRKNKFWWRLRLAFGNPPFLLGSILVAGLVVLAVFGERLAVNSPFETHRIMMIDGVIGAAPFPPSAPFPWGTDHLGRDIQAFVFSGAQRTLLLAFFATLARMAVGAVLGVFAGWWQDSWFDRLVIRLTAIWAAFPTTIFAMLVIEALGIQQGMSVFIAALCIVGWGEVTQFVRAQTIRIKPQLYIEAARALGAQPIHLLSQQVFPNLVSSLLVIAALEMGGVLMLLAELGFLNIFLGGGFRVEYSVNNSLHFSDVPEWGAMLANIRDWWRSYPWMAWYPGGAFLIAILTFNLMGEGLRHFIEETRVNLSRLFNRYSFAAIAIAIVAAGFLLQEISPINLYRSQAREFNADNVMSDIHALSSPTFAGRESGTEGSLWAAEYVAKRMREVGLFPSNPEQTYFTIAERTRIAQVGTPYLRFVDADGSIKELIYHADFSEYVDLSGTMGFSSGQVAGLALGPATDDPAIDAAAIDKLDLRDLVLVVRENDLPRLNRSGMKGLLVVSDDPMAISRRNLPRTIYWNVQQTAILTISQETANRLLATCGSSLEDLERRAGELRIGEVYLTSPGGQVDFSTGSDAEGNVENANGYYVHVIGVLPGTGAQTESNVAGVALDKQAIIVAAHLDGVGTSPDGILYPGANDNASGVATMLELARVLKSGEYPPKRTIIFIAWTGGDRYELLDLHEVIGYNPNLKNFQIEGVIELTGVGAGSGKVIAIGENSSFRMTQLYQKSAGKMGVRTTTRGRGPHYNFPVILPVTPRSAPTLYLSWDGSDELAHTLLDNFESIDPEKIEKVGQATMLMLTMMSREIAY